MDLLVIDYFYLEEKKQKLQQLTDTTTRELVRKRKTEE